jgi:hypothetical protein
MEYTRLSELHSFLLFAGSRARPVHVNPNCPQLQTTETAAKTMAGSSETGTIPAKTFENILLPRISQMMTLK